LFELPSLVVTNQLRNVWKRALPVAPVIALVAAAACGCSASSVTRPRAASADAAPKPKPSGCPTVLAALPALPPVTQQQAGSDDNALEVAGRKATGQAAVLADMAAVDAGYLRIDILSGSPVGADLRTWESGVGALRSYCRSVQ